MPADSSWPMMVTIPGPCSITWVTGISSTLCGIRSCRRAGSTGSGRIETWRLDYDQYRSLGSLGYLTPSKFLQQRQATEPRRLRFPSFELSQNGGNVKLDQRVESHLCLEGTMQPLLGPQQTAFVNKTMRESSELGEPLNDPCSCHWIGKLSAANLTEYLPNHPDLVNPANPHHTKRCVA